MGSWPSGLAAYGPSPTPGRRPPKDKGRSLSRYAPSATGTKRKLDTGSREAARSVNIDNKWPHRAVASASSLLQLLLNRRKRGSSRLPLPVEYRAVRDRSSASAQSLSLLRYGLGAPHRTLSRALKHSDSPSPKDQAPLLPSTHRSKDEQQPGALPT